MKEIKIGKTTIRQTASLAPMASVADRAYRELCRRYGAAMVTGEMVSAKGLYYSAKKSEELLMVTEGERPMAVQLFGDDPEIMALAAKKAAEYGPDFIDINMGCPVPKVVNNNSGSALMKQPELVGRIVDAVASAVDLPVTVKIRKGWDDRQVNAVEIARIAEQNGAAAVTVHGRTRQQMYQPFADWDIIREVKQAVSVPVIGNGDVDSAEKAKALYEKTGCDLVMVGRASYGNPWLFREIEHYLTTGEQLPPPTLEEKMRVMREHVETICEYKGLDVGIREARKHAAWYLKGLRGAADLRRQCGMLSSLDDLNRIIDTVLSENNTTNKNTESI